MKKWLSSAVLSITILLSVSLLGIGVQAYAHTTHVYAQNNSALLFSQAIYGKS